MYLALKFIGGNLFYELYNCQSFISIKRGSEYSDNSSEVNLKVSRNECIT